MIALSSQEWGEVVGGVGVLNELDDADGSCNFRILIGPQGRDRGLGTETVHLIADHPFRATGLWRISLKVYSFNPRARRVYERAGFRTEGNLRGALRFGDTRLDAIPMSPLRTDWNEKLSATQGTAPVTGRVAVRLPGPKGTRNGVLAKQCPVRRFGRRSTSGVE